MGNRYKYEPPPIEVMKVARDLTLTPKQGEIERVIAAGAKFIWLKAGRKFGKTTLCRHRIGKWAEIPPMKPREGSLVYIAPARKQAKKIIWRPLKAHFLAEALEKRPSESDLTISLKNGHMVSLEGAEDEDNIRGLTFEAVVEDEADFMRPMFHEEVVEPNMGVTQAPGLFISTPKNGWFTRKWKDAKDGRLGRQHAALHGTIYDNPHISREWIEAIQKKTSREIFEQEYMANESAKSGIQYSEFEISHVVPHRPPNPQALHMRSLDWGFEHPTHVLWFEVTTNPITGKPHLYFWAELSMRNQTVAAIAGPVLAREPGLAYIMNGIDPSGRRREMSSGLSIIGEFAKYGLLCTPATMDDDYRINSAKIMLRDNEVEVSDQCALLIKQLREVEWGQKLGDDAADAFKVGTSLIYGRDLSIFNSTEDKRLPNDPYRAPIDPLGILAKRESDSMEWEGFEDFQ